MKKFLVVGLLAGVMGLLAIWLVIPALAREPGSVGPSDEQAWEDMHEACEEGDREAMAETAEKWHGEDSGSMPCGGGEEDDGGALSGGGGGMMNGMMGGGMSGSVW